MPRGRQHRTTFVVPENLWELIVQRADDEGISASQFIREAALARVFYRWSDEEIDRVLELARSTRKP